MLLTKSHFPSFSVIIPTYQRRDLVREAVMSLGAQSYAGDVEIIVVVDGSTDGTAKALHDLEVPLGFRVIEQENRGAASARNRGAAEATGEIILFLDDDMIPAPDLIEQHASMYRQGAEAVIGHIPVDASSPPGFLTNATTEWIAAWKVSAELTPFDIFTGQLSVRRAIFDRLGGFAEEFTSERSFAHEDTEFGVRLLASNDVRYNPHAISSQRYVVPPREIMRRAASSAVADARFAATHPEYSRQLFEFRGAANKRTRFLYKPLAHVPLLPALCGEAAVRLADVALRSRFHSHALVSRFFSAAQGIVYWSAARRNARRQRSTRLLVLCYHAIRDQSGDPVLAPYGIPPEQLAAQFDWLRAAGFVFVTPNAAANFIKYGDPLPRRAVLVTFDDCYEELPDVARQILKPRNIPALAFAVSALDTNLWDQAAGSERLSLLDTDQLKALGELGVEIGSHSRTHRDMAGLSTAEVEREVTGSADDLETRGIPRPRFFAYPFGTVSAASKSAARKAGYVAAFGCGTDRVSMASDPFDLPRVGVFACDRGWRFRLKVRFPRLVATLGTIRSRAPSLRTAGPRPE